MVYKFNDKRSSVSPVTYIQSETLFDKADLLVKLCQTND